jgi:hypothetical protein
MLAFNSVYGGKITNQGLFVLILFRGIRLSDVQVPKYGTYRYLFIHWPGTYLVYIRA